MTFGGTAGVTGTSAAFTSGVLSGASVTPAVAGTSLTLTATSGAATGSATIAAVNPGAMSQLVMNPTTIATATAGTPVTLTSITAKDANGNTCSSGPNAFTGTVTFAGTAGATGTSAAFTAGVLTTFPALTPTAAGSGKTITATTGALVGTTTITTVNAGAASKLAFTTVPGTGIAGTAFSVTVQSQDAYGNPANVITATATITLSKATGGGTLSGIVAGTIAVGANSVTIATPVYSAADTMTLTATKSGSGPALTAATSGNIGFSPGAVSQLIMNPTTIASATAGSDISGSFVSITAKDANGNTCSNGPNTFTGTVTFAGTAGATGTSAAFTAGVLTTFPTLTPTVATAGSKTITATTGAIVGTTTITAVNPGPLDHFTVTTPTTQTAGTAFNITTITALDVYGNPLNTGPNAFTGTVDMTETGGGAGGTVSPATSSAFVAGVRSTQSATLTKSGTLVTITVTDHAGSGKTGTSGTFTVNAGVATKLAYTTVPSMGIAGTAFSVTVQSQDANGNPANVTSATTITLSKATGAGTLSGTLAGSIASGANTVTIATPVYSAADTMTLTAARTAGMSGLASVTSGNIVFSPGAIASYTVTATTPQTRGTAFNVTVTAKDANGNTVNTDNSTVVTNTSSTGNVLFDANGDSSFNNNVKTLTAGTFTISVKDNYFETVTFSAKDQTGKTGTSSSITINGLPGDYRSRVTGTWATASTWQTTSDGSTWVTAGSAPTSATTGQISVLNTHTVTVTASVTAQNLNIASGGGVAINTSQTLTVNNGVANGVINNGTSGGALAVTGGTLDLNGTNTYTGGTVINSGGTVSISSDGNLGNTSGGITFNGGTLQTTGSSAITTARAVTLGTGGGTVSLGVPLYFTGAISGGTGLTSGGNDLILNRASGNNAIGAITVNSGRLFVFTQNSINGSSVAVQSGATLDFNLAGSATYANTTTFASGACLANRVGTLTVSTANLTFPSSGTIIFNSDDQNTTAITVNGAYPTLTGNLTIQVGPTGNTTVGNVTLSGAISQSGGSYDLTKTSTGTLVLGSANSYTGGTTVSTGSLTANATGSLGSGALSIASGAMVTLTSGTTETVAALYLNGVPQTTGTWGGTASAASNKNSTYFGTSATGVLTAQSTPSSTALTSSLNPALPGTSVVFTATVTGAGTPTGTVQFKTNGVALGAAATLNGSGIATIASTTLAHGNVSVTAEYSGGGGFLTSTGSLTQVIDTPPTAGAHNLGATLNTPLAVSATTLAGLDYDADGDPLTITAVGSASHGTVGLSGGTITYTPTTSYVGTDAFTYTISDGYTGGTATSTANVTVRLGKATSVLYPPTVGIGVVNLVGYGIPGHAYDVQRSPDLSTWTTISLTAYASGITAAANGIVLYTDTNPLSTAYYRLAVH